MPRARNIKPGFFKNEALGLLPCGARLLFIGLWTLADREGRLEDRPARIAAELFPYDRSIAIGDIDLWLTQLADCEESFIVRYVQGNHRFIQISNFSKHQSPHVKEQASTIPAPDMHGASPVQAPDMPRKGNVLHPLNPDSLNPESPFTDTGIPMPGARAVRRELPLNGKTSSRWPEFLKLFPYQIDLDDACQQFVSVVSVETEGAVFACLQRYLASDQVARGAVMKPGNWLRTCHRDGWMSDWPKPQEPKARKMPKGLEDV